jgi:hypothetical protein
MRIKRTWTLEDKIYLEEHWGKGSLPYIAKCLNRSINAIKLKAYKLGLGDHLHSGKEITFFDLCKALGRENNYGYYLKRWSEYGCPIRLKKVIKEKFAVMDIEDFWKWAKQNKYLLDFSKFEKHMLGKEPDWVAKKRRADIAAKKYKTTPWTKTEDTYLISLLNSYQYGYREISIKLCRTEGAIKRRIGDLGLKQRPLKADNHIPWTDKEVNTILSMLEDGYKPEVMAEYVNRSALAIRGLLERTFGTEIYRMQVR